MKRVIDGCTYNTDTAELILMEYIGESSSEFHWEETGLYRARSGKLFLAGEGGPRTRWARYDSRDRSTSWGEGLRLVSLREAGYFMMDAGCTPDQIKLALL